MSEIGYISEGEVEEGDVEEGEVEGGEGKEDRKNKKKEGKKEEVPPPPTRRTARVADAFFFGDVEAAKKDEVFFNYQRWMAEVQFGEPSCGEVLIELGRMVASPFVWTIKSVVDLLTLPKKSAPPSEAELESPHEAKEE